MQGSRSLTTWTCVAAMHIILSVWVVVVQLPPSLLLGKSFRFADISTCPTAGGTPSPIWLAFATLFLLVGVYRTPAQKLTKKNERNGREAREVALLSEQSAIEAKKYERFPSNFLRRPFLHIFSFPHYCLPPLPSRPHNEQRGAASGRARRSRCGALGAEGVSIARGRSCS